MTDHEKHLIDIWDIRHMIRINEKEVLSYRWETFVGSNPDDDITRCLYGVTIFPANKFPSLKVGDRWNEEDKTDDQ